MNEVQHSEACGPDQLPKARTGVLGLDEMTGGGLPPGRPTPVTGAAGSSKAMLAMELLARGAAGFDEPGVLLAFEESRADLVQNIRSIGLDLEVLTGEKIPAIDYLNLDQHGIQEAGDAIVVFGTESRTALVNGAVHRLAGGDLLLRPFGAVLRLAPAGSEGAETNRRLRGLLHPRRRRGTGRVRPLFADRSAPDPARERRSRSRPLRRDRRVRGLHADISAQKEMEGRLAWALDDAARSTRELQLFANISSHDLQELLHMVTSYLQFHERRYRDEADGEEREFIGSVIVQRIVERRGVEVWLESTAGEGTTYCFTIPVTPPGEDA